MLGPVEHHHARFRRVAHATCRAGSCSGARRGCRFAAGGRSCRSLRATERRARAPYADDQPSHDQGEPPERALRLEVLRPHHRPATAPAPRAATPAARPALRCRPRTRTRGRAAAVASPAGRRAAPCAAGCERPPRGRWRGRVRSAGASTDDTGGGGRSPRRRRTVPEPGALAAPAPRRGTAVGAGLAGILSGADRRQARRRSSALSCEARLPRRSSRAPRPALAADSRGAGLGGHPRLGGPGALSDRDGTIGAAGSMRERPAAPPRWRFVARRGGAHRRAPARDDARLAGAGAAAAVRPRGCCRRAAARR